MPWELRASEAVICLVCLVRYLVVDMCPALYPYTSMGALSRAAQDVVRTSFKGRTVIMVAHRLNTVIDCDQV